MQAISLHDDVAVEVAGAASGAKAAAGPGVPFVRVEMAAAPDASDAALWSGVLPQGEDNLAYAAAKLALRTWGGPDSGASAASGVRVTIAKRIPMAAGLAGGSADAAAVMLALARTLSPETPLREIIAAGTTIGADVPFCISTAARGNPALGSAGDEAAGAAALCEGIGDELSPAAPGAGWAVLVRPAVAVSTPQVYADWDLCPARRGAGAEIGDNDLTPPAIARYPLIKDVLDEVRENSGADRVFMTGSGPTIVALYAEETAASRGFARMKSAYKNRAGISAVIISKLLS